MTVQEQRVVMQKEYVLAKRYMDNAIDMLKKAGREGNKYKDTKYVSSASGIAYRGVLIALECWLKTKDVKVSENKDDGQESRKQVGFYQKETGKKDKGVLRDFTGAYKALHLRGYYDCTDKVETINEGFKCANNLINRIKPEGVL